MGTTFDTGFDQALAEATAEQSKDQAPAVEPKEAEAAVSPKVEEKVSEAAQPADSDELLAKGEYDRLKADPEALRKALNTAFTQKTQAVAAERKQLAEQQKELEAYKELVESFKTDPKGTVRELAKNVGLDLSEVETKQEVKEAADRISDILSKNLSPELQFLAPQLSPAIKAAVQELASQEIKREVEPLRQQAQRLQEETVKEQIEANLKQFTEKHPDWKKHEAEMTKLGQMYQPVAGKGSPSWMDYMEMLYYVATKDAREGDIAKKTVERMTESAKKSETSDSGVAGQKVTKSAPKFTSFDEAFNQAAKDAQAGILYE